MLLLGDGEKEPFRNTPQPSVLNKACPQETPFCQGLTCKWGFFRASPTCRGEKYSTLVSPLVILSKSRRQKKKKALVNFTVQGHRLTTRLRPTRRAIERSPSLHAPSVKDLTAVPSIYYVISIFQQ